MQSDFLSKITETKSILPKLVSEINASGLPLLFYGAGDYARLLYGAVDAYSLHISDIVVTSKSDNASVFMGYKIQAIQDALGKYNKCNVLIAFQNSAAYEMAQIENNLLNSGKVAKVYYYDAVHSNYNSDLNLEYSFVVENQHILNNLYNILYDDFSRDVLTGFFNQRISGNIHYLKNLCTNNQYFPDFIKLKDNETFVDCGAYDGDSIESFYNVPIN